MYFYLFILFSLIGTLTTLTIILFYMFKGKNKRSLLKLMFILGVFSLLISFLLLQLEMKKQEEKFLWLNEQFYTEFENSKEIDLNLISIKKPFTDSLVSYEKIKPYMEKNNRQQIYPILLIEYKTEDGKTETILSYSKIKSTNNKSSFVRFKHLKEDIYFERELITKKGLYNPQIFINEKEKSIYENLLNIEK